MGLPPGVVVFPSGNLLLTASVGAQDRSLPDQGELRYAQFGEGVESSKVEAAVKIGYSEELALQLGKDFQILRMTFPVR